MDINSFKDHLKDSEKILIITSQPCDADCIASGVIVKKYLDSLDIENKLLFPRKLTQEEKDYYSDLPHFDELLITDTRDALKEGDFDTLILLDGANWVQFYDYKNETLPKPEPDKSKKIIQIDHHLNNHEKFASIKIIDSKASSTIEIILRDLIPIEFLDQNLATLAYAGLSSDTGNFRWNFNPTTLQLASKLLEKDANPAEIVNKMFFSKKREDLEMLAYALNNIEFDDKLKSQFLFLPLSKKQKDGITEEKYEILKIAYYDIARSIVGYDRGFIMTEDKEPGKIAIGARGNNLNNKISLPDLFKRVGGNGGGHFNAAGMDVTGDFEEVKTRLKNEIKKSLESNDE